MWYVPVRMLVSSSTSSFLGSGVYVSTNTGSAKTTQSASSKQAEATDSYVFNMNVVESEPSTDEQIARKLEQMKAQQRQAELKSTQVKLAKLPDRKVEETKPEDAPPPKEPAPTTSEVPPPSSEAPKSDMSFDYARVENDKAREVATRDFLTVGMSSRFVESQSATTS